MSVENRDKLHDYATDYYKWAKVQNVAKEGITDNPPLLFAQRGRYRVLVAANFGDPELRREMLMFLGFMFQPDAFALCIESYTVAQQLPKYAHGDLEKAFASGDPNVSEALSVSTMAPESRLVVSVTPFHYHGKDLVWQDEKRTEMNVGNIPDDMIAGLAGREAGLQELASLPRWDFDDDDFISVLLSVSERFQDREVHVAGVVYGDDGTLEAQWN